MAPQGGGGSIFISSMVGPQSLPGRSRVRAVEGWSRGADARARGRARRTRASPANAIAPGFFLTERNAPFFTHPRIVEMARRIPLQRFGRPDEIVGAAIFLASDAASYITPAQVMTVDAGLSVAL
jgi:gluconate 5-dehydrogenase